MMETGTDEGSALDMDISFLVGGKVLGSDGKAVARTPEANYT